MRFRIIRVIVGWVSFSIITAETVVIGIFALALYRNVPSQDLQKQSGAPPLFGLTVSSGTGFFFDGSGEILTDRHVVNSCRRITVFSKSIGSNRAILTRKSDSPEKDLALIHVSIRSPAVARLVHFEKPYDVNAFASLRRPLVIARYTSLADTNLSMEEVQNPELVRGAGNGGWLLDSHESIKAGNSGSPVFDGNGHVIGIVTQGHFDFVADQDRDEAISNESLSILSPTIIDWLGPATIRTASAVGVNASFEEIPKAAIVKVFCFN